MEFSWWHAPDILILTVSPALLVPAWAWACLLLLQMLCKDSSQLSLPQTQSFQLSRPGAGREVCSDSDWAQLSSSWRGSIQPNTAGLCTKHHHHYHRDPSLWSSHHHLSHRTSRRDSPHLTEPSLVSCVGGDTWHRDNTKTLQRTLRPLVTPWCPWSLIDECYRAPAPAAAQTARHPANLRPLQPQRPRPRPQARVRARLQVWADRQLHPLLLLPRGSTGSLNILLALKPNTVLSSPWPPPPPKPSQKSTLRRSKNCNRRGIFEYLNSLGQYILTDNSGQVGSDLWSADGGAGAAVALHAAGAHQPEDQEHPPHQRAVREYRTSSFVTGGIFWWILASQYTNPKLLNCKIFSHGLEYAVLNSYFPGSLWRILSELNLSGTHFPNHFRANGVINRLFYCPLQSHDHFLELRKM